MGNQHTSLVADHKLGFEGSWDISFVKNQNILEYNKLCSFNHPKIMFLGINIVCFLS